YYEADDAASIWLYQGPGIGTNPFFRAHIAANGGVIPKPYSRTIGSEIETSNKPKIWGVSGKATVNLGDLTLTSLTSYRETHPLNFNDLDITSAPTLTQLREERHDQVSQEFQLSSPTGRKFEWLLGAYYFNENNDIRNEYQFLFIDDMFGLPNTPGCCVLQLNGKAKSRAYAVFGEANYDLTERLNLVVGGRYSTEKRGGANAVAFVNFLQPMFDNIANFQSANFDAFSPKVGLNFQASRDTLLYVSASRGFKSGGFNIGSYQNTPFNPEKIRAYEAGAKMDLLDRRLRLNAATFFYQYADLQVQDVEGQNIVIRNAAKAEILGVELESIAVVTQAFRIDAALTWLDATFKDTCLADPKHPLPAPDPGCNGANQRNIDGLQLPRAPKLKVAVGAQYTVPLASGARIVVRSDYAWQDKIYFSAFEVAELSERSYGWAKARVTYFEPDNRWRIAAFIDNIGDVKVMSNLTYSADLVDAQAIGVMAPPRTFGVQASFNF
ncbi:MAG: TonB-dependent receptor, partial [bacterium]|nr:TonB-dependent receptor [bacterium]